MLDYSIQGEMQVVSNAYEYRYDSSMCTFLHVIVPIPGCLMDLIYKCYLNGPKAILAISGLLPVSI